MVGLVCDCAALLDVRKKDPEPCLPLPPLGMWKQSGVLEEFSLKINLWDGAEAQFELIPTEGIVFSGKCNRNRHI